MPIDLKRAREINRKDKVSIFCCTCTKYWEARDRGLPGHQCLSTTRCASPLGGGDFHDYDGPLTETSRWCFVCGDPSTRAVKSPKSERLFGLCGRHAHFAHALVPVGVEAPVVVVKDGADIILAERLVRAPRRSKIVEEMIATQQQWDEDDAKGRS